MRNMSVREFRELGLLIEVNRRVLHPVGVALEVAAPIEALTRLDLTDGGVEALGKLIAFVRDHDESMADEMDALEGRLREAPRYEVGELLLRGILTTDDAEGIYYDDDQLRELAPFVEAGQRFSAPRAAARFNALGYVVQPLPDA